MRARMSGHEIAERIRDRLQERHGDPDGKRHAQRVAESARVLDRGDPADAADRDLDRAARVDQGDEVGGGLGHALRLVAAILAQGPVGFRSLSERSETRGVGCIGRFEPRRDLARVERSEQAQQIRDALDAARTAGRIQPLRLALELGDDFRVQQLAQLDRAEQLAQQGRIHRQRGGPALRERGVALVHEGADVAE